ncbi:hypothetical protein PR048_013154 [Dryococelus australis]|uniref:Reverse transcriptase RNase H-like domain-containing protein n=1 Tax=Dryococelus australis TaxID=614101 RepID=A0ABQ9HRP1_9NEOP|nr:hypothetical protein PR048_013154 [Dryococelus australis]
MKDTGYQKWEFNLPKSSMGAVLPLGMSSGEKSFASKTLSRAEAEYSQVERRVLSLAFAMNKLHNYLKYGCKFVIVTNHRVLAALFGTKLGVLVMAES